HDVHQALLDLAWAPPQDSAQPLAGEDHVAGVEYNDESHDVEVGSDRELINRGRDIHGLEVADIAFMREVRVARRKINAKAAESWASQAHKQNQAFGSRRA
ncbi:MAG: hypothetical protein ACKPKO_33305, partial [Candidatus Fonsibacter sp.]